MKRFKYTIFLLALTACTLLCGACEDEQTEGVDLVETTRIKDIGHETAVCVGYVRGTCSERGVCYADLTTPDRIVTLTAKGGGETFEVTLTGLETGHSYTCYVYARANGQIVRGEAKTFRTLEEGQPYLLTGKAINVKHHSATLEGYVFTNGGQEILERGFCYGTAAEPSLDDETCARVTLEGGLGQMSLDVDGLADKTDYYACIYLRTAAGLFYSPVTRFRTLSYNKPRIAITGFERQGEQIVVHAKSSAVDPADEELETACGVIVGTTDDYEQGTVYPAETTTIGEFKVVVPADRNAGYIWAWASNKEGREMSNAATSRASVSLEEKIDVRSRWMAPTFSIENLGILDGDVLEAGVCWSETGDATVESDRKVCTEALAPGTYAMPLFYGLKTGTTYRVRAYVTNPYGTAYSKAVEVTTAPDLFDTYAGASGGTVRKRGTQAPYFYGWQVISNDPPLSTTSWAYCNNVPHSLLTDAFRTQYDTWNDMLIAGTDYRMSGVIYRITSMTGTEEAVTGGEMSMQFYVCKKTSVSGSSYTHTFEFIRNADGTMVFGDKIKWSAASPYSKFSDELKAEVDKVYTYFTEHPFYLEWGVEWETFKDKVTGSTSSTVNADHPNRNDGPIWMVPVDEPEKYWTLTNKHK